jgi:hypothetical protein
VLPYRILRGAATTSTATTTASTAARYCNFVVVHDIFDSLAKTQLLLAPVLRNRPGCSALLFAYPGQADATNDNSTAGNSAERCTNEVLAPLLHELLQHVQLRGYMSYNNSSSSSSCSSISSSSSMAPLHLIGIGTGAMTALAFAAAYCHTAPYGTATNSSSSSSSSAARGALQSVVCLNGSAAIDAQLSAVLHATAAAFAALPQARPELAASYFARFALGEEVSLRFSCFICILRAARSLLMLRWSTQLEDVVHITCMHCARMHYNACKHDQVNDQ